MQLVCFFLDNQEFGVPIDDVRETIGLRPITPVFRTPPCIRGIVNLRGEILAVLDPAVLLELTPRQVSDETRIVILEPDERAAGVLVDRLGSIREVEAEAIAGTPATVPRGVAAMLSGVVSLPERPVGVLSADRLLSAPELHPFTRAGRSQGSPVTTAEEG